jgi:hypothetical protein
LSESNGSISCSTPHDAVRFPLAVSETGRYLVDRTGRPFFIHGDSPWEIPWRLTREETLAYLEDRQRKGFYALLQTLWLPNGA